MRIVEIDIPEFENIEPALSRLVASEDALTAFKAKRLLDLVRHLQAQGPAPAVCGMFTMDELWLSPQNPANKASVKIWVDWFDYAPLKAGVPESHYRLQIQHGNCTTSRDARAATVEEAERAIWEAFGWST